MNTLIIEPQKEADYQLFVSLAKRLKVKFKEEMQPEPVRTKAQILRELKEDFTAAKNGTLKTRPLKDILNEI